MPGLAVGSLGVLVAHAGGGLVPRGTRVEVFRSIYTVFLLLGTVVGVVVVAYTLYKAYQYRENGDRETAEETVDRPELGELPQGSGNGRKLALSLTLSAIIVVSLIAWTYFTLLYVEGAGAPDTVEGEEFTVEVEGFRFGWRFTYPDGTNTTNVLRVPAGRPVVLRVSSMDVFHNFGIPAFRVKTDAIPGQSTDTWFVPTDPGNYTANCYELCGVGHSTMTARVVVMKPSAFQRWYTDAGGAAASRSTGDAGEAGGGAAVRAPDAALTGPARRGWTA